MVQRKAQAKNKIRFTAKSYTQGYSLVFGLSVVMAYYFVDSTRPYFLEVIQMKENYGYWFSAVSTAFFGGLIPFVSPV